MKRFQLSRKSWCLSRWFTRIKKSMGMHDTECPSWDKVSLKAQASKLTKNVENLFHVRERFSEQPASFHLLLFQLHRPRQIKHKSPQARDLMQHLGFVQPLKSALATCSRAAAPSQLTSNCCSVYLHPGMAKIQKRKRLVSTMSRTWRPEGFGFNSHCSTVLLSSTCCSVYLHPGMAKIQA